jgi:hypothetical protein
MKVFLALNCTFVRSGICNFNKGDACFILMIIISKDEKTIYIVITAV